MTLASLEEVLEEVTLIFVWKLIFKRTLYSESVLEGTTLNLLPLKAFLTRKNTFIRLVQQIQKQDLGLKSSF